MKPRDSQRLLYVLGALVVSASVLGFFAGVRDTGRARVYRTPRVRYPGELDTAPSYRDEREARRGNRARHAGNLAAMAELRPALFDPVPDGDVAGLTRALAARALRRAYAGAPPTIPHGIDDIAVPACLTCHERGMQVGQRVASAMPHPRYDSCTQCHAQALPSVPRMDLPLGAAASAENSFVGLEEQRGTRAWIGAPPTVPHRTAMRSQCESCHGVLGAGIRSTHPWRQSCRQCHAQAGTLDQSPQGGVDESTPPWATLNAPGMHAP
ncbi:MAG: hypothetical protein Q8Q09_09135 [Deltaproteobacteria bacterium]|nr:hypothetical protein [Deltaproteobacteria bacterium]